MPLRTYLRRFVCAVRSAYYGVRSINPALGTLSGCADASKVLNKMPNSKFEEEKSDLVNNVTVY